MSMFRLHPAFLELIYKGTVAFLNPGKSLIVRSRIINSGLIFAERLFKKPVFDCQMCGQCVLHNTGMTCPMTCPKSLRNGPCGGVRNNGNCEVKPEMMCVWVTAWERSKQMPLYGPNINAIMAPLDRRLQDTSAWVNELSGRTEIIQDEWSS